MSGMRGVLSFNEKQPDQVAILSACGWLANHKQLKKDLSEKGFPVQQETTEEYFLRAYQCWGENCPEKLIGDFAFAVWDPRTQTLFCARDRMGIKPFYYVLTKDFFAFSSDIGFFFNSNLIEKKPEYDSMAVFLQTTSIPRDRTFYSQVKRLPPASTLCVNKGDTKISVYWQPRSDIERGGLSLEENAEEFVTLFQKVIHDTMPQDTPAGVLVSGGLDSSSVLAVAAENKTAPFPKAYSMVFDQLECDEREYLEPLVQKVKVSWNAVTVDHSGFDAKQALKEYYRLAPHWPVRGIIPSVLWPLVQQAREQGVKVMLTGHGGDFLTEGNYYFLFDLLRQGKWRDLLSKCGEIGFSFSILQRYLFRPLIPPPLQDLLRKMLGKKAIPGSLNRKNYPSTVSWGEISALCSISTSLWLDGWWDSLGSPFGIECRHPFFDKRLVEFFLSIPIEQKRDGLWTKILLREGMKNRLPQVIHTRWEKAEFDTVIQYQSSFWEPDEILDSHFLKDCGILRNPKGLDIWLLISLNKWFEHNFECGGVYGTKKIQQKAL